MTPDSDVFVWTEVFNCGELTQVVVPSYLAHHDLPVHVFGFAADLEWLPDDPQVVPVLVDGPRSSSAPSENYIRQGYRRGHLGTARLFEFIFRNRPESILIHFDADIIFVGSSVRMILAAFEAGGLAAGLRRPYRYNPHGRMDVVHLQDCLDTVCFGVWKDALPSWSRRKFIRRIRGRYSRLEALRGWRSLDFFDPVTHSLAKEGEITYLDSPDAGSSAQQGKGSDFYNSFIQVWSAVGSGCAFTKVEPTEVSQDYVRYAKQSYALYAHYLLGAPLVDVVPAPGEVEDALARLDRASWTMSPPKSGA